PRCPYTALFRSVLQVARRLATGRLPRRVDGQASRFVGRPLAQPELPLPVAQLSRRLREGVEEHLVGELLHVLRGLREAFEELPKQLLVDNLPRQVVVEEPGEEAK